MPSTNATPPASFQRGRSAFLRTAGSALPIASRTIRRCTFSFFATPAIVPMPNSYSLRISSNSSTFVLQSNEFLRSGSTPDQEYPFVRRVGQNKLPKWASSEYRNHQSHRQTPASPFPHGTDSSHPPVGRARDRALSRAQSSRPSEWPPPPGPETASGRPRWASQAGSLRG